MSCSNLCVFLVFVGPRPRSFVVSLLFWRRNANLAGGFAGRLVPWFFVFFLFACFAFATYFDCTAGTTAFLSPRFSLFIRITGPSLRASSAKPGEKKSHKTTLPWSKQHGRHAMLYIMWTPSGSPPRVKKGGAQLEDLREFDFIRSKGQQSLRAFDQNFQSAKIEKLWLKQIHSTFPCARTFPIILIHTCYDSSGHYLSRGQ